MAKLHKDENFNYCIINLLMLEIPDTIINIRSAFDPLFSFLLFLNIKNKIFVINQNGNQGSFEHQIFTKRVTGEDIWIHQE